VKDFYFIIDTGGYEADSAHSVARSQSKEMVVEFVNLSSNNREMDWRFLLNHKQNKGKLSFIIIIIIQFLPTYSKDNNKSEQQRLSN